MSLAKAWVWSFLALLLFGRPDMARASEWVDMGPLKGSVEGHVWSKVINEAGVTSSRAESWQVSISGPAAPEFRLRCADPYSLEVRVQSQNAYGEISEYLLDRVAGGFHKKFSSVWDPKTTRAVRVLVASRHPETDQRYQLTLGLFDGAGKPLTEGSARIGEAGPPAETAELLGMWLRMENGRVAEYMQLVELADGVEIRFLAPDAQTVTSRLTGQLRQGVLSATSDKRKLRIVATGERLDYTSSNLDGTAAWNTQFTRK